MLTVATKINGFENRDPLKGDGNAVNRKSVLPISLITLKTETRLKGMETPDPFLPFGPLHTALKTETRLKGMETLTSSS